MNKNKHLSELRSDWERTALSVLIFPLDKYTFFVLAEYKSNYRLLRYIEMVGGKWQISVDKEGLIKDCLTKMSDEMQAYETLYDE